MTYKVSMMDQIPNNNVISEAGLSRLLARMQDRHFAILTAYRGNKSKQENIKRNRELRGELNKDKMGPIPLIGHWQECDDPDMDYQDCPKNQLTDVVERSYFVTQPDGMTTKQFKDTIQKHLKKFDQDGAVIKTSDKVDILGKDGSTFSIGSNVSLNKISQGYSQHVKKANVPFVFEGIEVAGSIYGKQVMLNEGIHQIGISSEDMALAKSWDDILKNPVE